MKHYNRIVRCNRIKDSLFKVSSHALGLGVHETNFAVKGWLPERAF